MFKKVRFCFTFCQISLDSDGPGGHHIVLSNSLFTPFVRHCVVVDFLTSIFIKVRFSSLIMGKLHWLVLFSNVEVRRKLFDFISFYFSFQNSFDILSNNKKPNIIGVKTIVEIANISWILMNISSRFFSFLSLNILSRQMTNDCKICTRVRKILLSALSQLLFDFIILFFFVITNKLVTVGNRTLFTLKYTLTCCFFQATQSPQLIDSAI